MIAIDASVATKLINTQEDGADRAKKLLLSHIEDREQIVVPSLLFVEIANVLATKSHMKKAYVQKALHLLYEAKFVVHEIKEDDLIESAILAKKHGTSVYDMVYAVIAKKRKIKLITADKKFAKQVNFPFVQIL